MLLLERLFKSLGRKKIIAAAAAGNLGEVQALVGARRDLVDAKDDLGRTPLEWAALHSHTPVADFLLSKGAHCDIFTAATLGDVERVKTMVKADPTLVHKSGGIGTPLHAAASKGRAEVIAFLTANGADLSVLGVLDLPPLHCAVAFCQPEAVRVLVESGADVNSRDKQDRTALQIAMAEIGSREKLEKSGFEKADSEFWTAQSEHAETWKQIADFLRQRGARE